jgi:hypothetical protein
MRNNGFFRNWFRGAQAPSVDQAEEEIDEELMFHLRSLVDDELAGGSTFDTAWDRARGRFGSLRRYTDACRGVAAGNHRVRQMLLALSLLLSVAIAGWLLLEVRSLRQEQLRLAAATASQPAHSVDIEVVRDDLAGRVVDRQGEPIRNASVAVILKTWPGGWYRQEAFSATSDADGEFRLAHLIPRDGQYAIQAAVVTTGYALTSTYRLIEEGSHPLPDPVMLQCDVASQITLVVHDEFGRPVANARVTPHSRLDRSGASHVVYFQASRPFQASSDAEGRVPMGCFEKGDRAEIYVQIPGEDWELRSIEIPHDSDMIIVTIHNS